MANEVVGLRLVCGGMLLFLENVASVPTIIKQPGSHHKFSLEAYDF